MRLEQPFATGWLPTIFEVAGLISHTFNSRSQQIPILLIYEGDSSYR